MNDYPDRLFTVNGMVELNERYVEGEIPIAELSKVRTSAHSAWARIGAMRKREYALAELVNNLCWQDRQLEANGNAILRMVQVRSGLVIPAAPIRCVFGYPGRPFHPDPTWLTQTVVDLARAVYEDRSFEGMPILADALEEAGCDDLLVLTHCRGGEPHARGCFVLDVILGKE